MNDLIQYAIVGLIVMVAVIAVVRSVVSTIRNKRTVLTACTGCKLQEYCQRPEKNSAKKCADKVAQVKNQQ